MNAKLQNVSTVDLYYICQMADNITRAPGTFIRNIEDIFGDAASSSLARVYPKFTCYHDFIEQIISSVIWESANNRYKVEVEGKGLWIDNLIHANDDYLIRDDWEEVSRFRGSVEDYLEFLADKGVIDQVCKYVSNQVFYVLFSNRYTMRAFGRMVSPYVMRTAIDFVPEAFSNAGFLKRKRVPKWAMDAVFHRDKGRCVFCRADMTKVYSIGTKTHFDHIVPLAEGGLNCVTNLQLACEDCNLKKGARNDHTSYEYEPWFR